VRDLIYLSTAKLARFQEPPARVRGPKAAEIQVSAVGSAKLTMPEQTPESTVLRKLEKSNRFP